MSKIVQFSKRRRTRAPIASANSNAQPNEFASIRIMRGQFVFDERRGSFHRVSETAGFVLAELQRSQPIETIIAAYAQRYGISTIVAQRDVELFVNDLPGVGLRRQPAPSPAGQRRRRSDGAPARRPPSQL